jgi:hypothetical protein
MAEMTSETQPSVSEYFEVLDGVELCKHTSYFFEFCIFGTIHMKRLRYVFFL